MFVILSLFLPKNEIMSNSRFHGETKYSDQYLWTLPRISQCHNGISAKNKRIVGIHRNPVAQSARAKKYTDCILAEG